MYFGGGGEESIVRVSFLKGDLRAPEELDLLRPKFMLEKTNSRLRERQVPNQKSRLAKPLFALVFSVMAYSTAQGFVR